MLVPHLLLCLFFMTASALYPNNLKNGNFGGAKTQPNSNSSSYLDIASSDALIKRRVLSDLETIRHIFEVKYAPLQWKGEYAKWTLDAAIEEAKNKISSLQNPTIKECQVIVRDFFNSTRDYHVGVRFFSTESASLPFMIKGAQKRYFICELCKKELPDYFPFAVGDEILSFDGKPIDEVVNELRYAEFGTNALATDLSLAEMSLTYRHGSHGNRVPRGCVVIAGRKKGEEEVISTKLQWNYFPEKISDFSKIGSQGLSCSVVERGETIQNFLKESSFFQKLMVFHQWDRPKGCAEIEMSPHNLGSRSSYLPRLGKEIIWKTSTTWNFDAYIFETRSGSRIGYIRIPHYEADVEEFNEFGEIMRIFEKKTDALVIDQLNNPGGSLFYLYALVSTLANKPYFAPKHHLSLTQEEVQMAVTILSYLDQVDDEWSARSVLGDEVGGYPVNFEFASLLREFCIFLINQWNTGKVFTDQIHLLGVDQIKPHPVYRYTKPILVLINSLDFSCGDFFPAILQDNKRAVLMGTTTAGAGGYVFQTTFPNHSGIKGFNMTGSICRRMDQQPIENLGVKPDITYELTPEDLQMNYQPFVEEIVKTVEFLLL